MYSYHLSNDSLRCLHLLAPFHSLHQNFKLWYNSISVFRITHLNKINRCKINFPNNVKVFDPKGYAQYSANALELPSSFHCRCTISHSVIQTPTPHTPTFLHSASLLLEVTGPFRILHAVKCCKNWQPQSLQAEGFFLPVHRTLVSVKCTCFSLCYAMLHL